MAVVEKRLTQRIVAPSCARSNRVSRPILWILRVRKLARFFILCFLWQNPWSAVLAFRHFHSLNLADARTAFSLFLWLLARSSFLPFPSSPFLSALQAFTRSSLSIFVLYTLVPSTSLVFSPKEKTCRISIRNPAGRKISRKVYKWLLSFRSRWKSDRHHPGRPHPRFRPVSE